MSHSIRSGLEAIIPESPDAVLIALADQPFVTEMLLKHLISVYLKDPSVGTMLQAGKGSCCSACYSVKVDISGVKLS